MRIRIHRGARQIGGTCIELAYGSSRIALDLGLPLNGEAGDASLLPAIAGDGLAAVVISHPHIDHYGLLPHLTAGVPVAMGEAARHILKAAAPFTRQPLPDLNGPALRDRETFEIGPFRITPYLVDHSAFDAYSLLIEAGKKRVFYSGDFRGHGRKAALFERLIADPPRNIDVLFMEGSSLSRLDEDETFPTEQDLENDLVGRLKDHTGIAMVHTSAQNIDRIVTLTRAAKRTSRTLVIDLYSAAILAATGHPSIPQSDWPGVALYVPKAQRLQIKENSWFELLERHSRHRIYPEDFRVLAPRTLLLYRPLMMRDLEKTDCLAGARFIYSHWPGYLQRGNYATTERWLAKHGITIEYLHTSGHASPADLKRFAHALKPKALVPIHSFMPERYPALFENVRPHPDGEWWEA